MGALVLLTGALIARNLLTLSPIGADALEALPEASIRYPGSESLLQGRVSGSDDILGTTPPSWWRILGTNAPIQDVLAHYDVELVARGWGVPRQVANTTVEVEAYRWDRGALRFRLGFLETGEWHRRIEGSDRWPVLYVMRLYEDPRDDQTGKPSLRLPAPHGSEVVVSPLEMLSCAYRVASVAPAPGELSVGVSQPGRPPGLIRRSGLSVAAADGISSAWGRFSGGDRDPRKDRVAGCALQS